jgi:hypothetical protein
MTPQEIQEINERMAIEIMHWHKDNAGYWVDKNGRWTGWDSINSRDRLSTQKYFNPWKVIDHAFLVLHKWLEEHPGWGYTLNRYECRLYKMGALKVKGIAIELENSESQAICNCLMQTKE